MIEIDLIKDTCTGCSACYSSCPNGSIRMVKNEYGFAYPSINNKTCIDCHICEKVCVVLNEKSIPIKDKRKATFYAAWAKQKYMDKNATSGGIVSVIAQNFVHDGIVCGASFDSDLMGVKHVVCKTSEDVRKITGSKYVQSDVSNCFIDIKMILETGEKVLFIGTPCQVAGLYSFLKKRYDNLYTIDFLCHGVPSPMAWKKYVQYLEKKFSAKLVKYNFRAKLSGWGKIEQTAEFLPKRKYREVGAFNPYHNWFGEHLSLRNSCFHCIFRSDQRVSDITVADFWGIEKYYPEIPRRQGVSCVMLNTNKGQLLFDKASREDQIVFNPASYESMWEHRKTAFVNFEEPKLRKQFLADLSSLSGSQLIKLYPAPSFGTLLLRKFLAIISRH